jgi:hypothetical protein
MGFFFRANRTRFLWKSLTLNIIERNRLSAIHDFFFIYCIHTTLYTTTTATKTTKSTDSMSLFGIDGAHRTQFR